MKQFTPTPKPAEWDGAGMRGGGTHYISMSRDVPTKRVFSLFQSVWSGGVFHCKLEACPKDTDAPPENANCQKAGRGRRRTYRGITIYPFHHSSNAGGIKSGKGFKYRFMSVWKGKLP